MEIKIKADEIVAAIRKDKIQREFYMINRATEEMQKQLVKQVPIYDLDSGDTHMKNSYNFEQEVVSAIKKAGYKLVVSDGTMWLSLDE